MKRTHDGKINNSMSTIAPSASISLVRRTLPVQQAHANVDASILSTFLTSNGVVSNRDTDVDSNFDIYTSSSSKKTRKNRTDQNTSIDQKECPQVVPNEEDVEAAEGLLKFVSFREESEKKSWIPTEMPAASINTQPSCEVTSPKNQLPRFVTDESCSQTGSASANSVSVMPNVYSNSFNCISFGQSPIAEPHPVVGGYNNHIARAAPANSSEQQTRIISPKPNDILCGQDKTYSKHHGNQLLRGLLIETVPRYLDILRITSVNGKKKKATEMYKDMVIKIKTTYKSRFLKLAHVTMTATKSVNNDNASQKSKGSVDRLWVEINDKLARDKVSHALRTYMKKYVAGHARLHGGACADGNTYHKIIGISSNVSQPVDVDVIDDKDDDEDDKDPNKKTNAINTNRNNLILRQFPMDVNDTNDLSYGSNNIHREVTSLSTSRHVGMGIIKTVPSDRSTNLHNIGTSVTSLMDSTADTSSIYTKDVGVEGTLDQDVQIENDDDDEGSFSFFDEDNREELEELYNEQQEMLREMLHVATLPPHMVMIPTYYDPAE